jgi:hypothetical protein
MKAKEESVLKLRPFERKLKSAGLATIPGQVKNGYTT